MNDQNQPAPLWAIEAAKAISHTDDLQYTFDQNAAGEIIAAAHEEQLEKLRAEHGECESCGADLLTPASNYFCHGCNKHVCPQCSVVFCHMGKDGEHGTGDPWLRMTALHQTIADLVDSAPTGTSAAQQLLDIIHRNGWEGPASC